MLRSTAECEQMNAVYDALKGATPSELLAMYRESLLQHAEAMCNGDLKGQRHLELFMYQLFEHVRRRSITHA